MLQSSFYDELAQHIVLDHDRRSIRRKYSIHIHPKSYIPLSDNQNGKHCYEELESNDGTHHNL
ncbi:hypothetical protein PGT21_033897 [Puccinia graminis f. sp. tritici]|uniref:Uncharacterized protein n=1 Tax=Puccinia graminis f. sp. tritici TaxID=56615 RepID=A0A5B0MZY3_PUCGR|nr:hypothetical protein PGT21_033897 [Puccinia graminis f. sp. tritici]KAA1081826.1 hypothetical protein PGTUg99_014278 [Puccinia graminis f. sp. tritici]